ncbi:MAG: SAM-dependent methyltransferase [Acidobacteria bacterium]|nr:SAM-dependent methyltransferase [Acidobacteriota bacterium]
MPVLLKQIIPLGRTLREYELMFALTEADRTKKILGCGDGPASFNAEWTARGGSVISIDPIYEFSGAQIKERFDAVINDIIADVEATQDRWVWEFQQTPQGLRQNRVAAMDRFLADYEAGKRAGRYQVAELPTLPFQDGAFDLALCSHLLLLYSHLLSLDFHVQAVQELCRVAQEVRVFPLLDLVGNKSEHLDPLRIALEQEGIETVIEQVPYEFQQGGNQMLRAVRNYETAGQIT